MANFGMFFVGAICWAPVIFVLLFDRYSNWNAGTTALMSWSAVAFMCIAGLRLALKFNRGGFLAWTIATGPMIWLLGAITTTLPQLVIYGSRTALTPREADSLVMPNIVMWAILAFLLYKIALWFGSTVISDADNAGLNSPESKEKL